MNTTPTCCIYFNDSDGIIQHYSLCFISDDNKHDTSFAYKIQNILVDYLEENLPTADVL